MDLRDAFRDDNGDVCSAFFGVSHNGDVAGVARVWSDMRRLADGRCVSDTDFWTVVAHHERLAVALSTCVTTALHHTRNGSDSVVSTSDEAAVAAVLVRLATTTEVCMQRNVDVASLATRLEQLLPSRLLPPMAVVLLRHCASCSRQHNKDNDDKDKTTTAAAAAAVDTRAAAATVTSLLLLCPPLLCRLRQHMAGWCDDVDKLAVRCVVEARRGRYQRSAGDVLALLSLTHRTPQPLWAALQCAPLLADYVPLQRTLRALRVLVDVAMPLVQHMVLVCDALTPRRAALTRLCAATVNAAVHAAMLLLLYRTYSVRLHDDRGSNAIAAAAAAATTRTQPQYVWSMPALVQTTYTALHAYVRTHVGGYPRVLLDSWCNNSSSSSNNNNVHTLMHHLVPPLLDDTTTADVHLGHVLLTLTAPLRDSSDVAVALRHARVQFAEAVLRALVQQGMRLHTLVRDRLVTHDEAQQLGGTPDDCNATKQQQEQEQQQQQPQQHDDADDAGSSSSDDDDDKADAATRAAVAMVRGVFAHFTRRGVRAALAYYGNDTEQLVLDASADNLPPHLLPLLHKQPQPSSSSRPRQQSGDVAQHAMPGDEAMQQQQQQSDEDALDVPALCRRILRECDDDDDGAVSQPQHGDEDEGSAAVLSLGNDDVLYDTLLSQPGNDKDSTRDATAAVTSSSPWLYTTRVDGAAATHGDAVGMSAAFRVDDATREKIRVLSALMYDDELDDHALDETHVDDDVDHNVTDDDDDKLNNNNNNNNNSAALHAQQPPPDVHAGGGDEEARRVRDTYHDKQWHAQRARERATRAAAAATTSSRPQPAYANKRKTTTTRRDGKGDVQRALRKGRVDVF